jgi:hypothetical protein
MKTLYTGTAALLLGAGLLGGCAENTPELYILQNGILDEDCAVPSNAGATSGTFLSRGVLDLLVTNQYQMLPIVQNSLVSSESVTFSGGGGGGGGLTGVEWEANTITLSRARVVFDAPDALGVPLPRQLDIPIAGSVEPDGSLAVQLQVVQAQVGNLLRQSPFLRQSGSTLDMLLRVKFFGTTGGQRDVDSNEFVFPVTLCFGCLLTVPPEAVDPALPTPNCLNTEGFESTSVDVACNPGQDEAIDCRLFCPIFGEDEDPTGICIPN